jgi:hypothetical protein
MSNVPISPEQPRFRNRMEELTGFRWPAECRFCDLVTEDPDAYFRPKDWDDEQVDEWTRCLASPTGLHEPRPAA